MKFPAFSLAIREILAETSSLQTASTTTTGMYITDCSRCPAPVGDIARTSRREVIPRDRYRASEAQSV